MATVPGRRDLEPLQRPAPVALDPLAVDVDRRTDDPVLVPVAQAHGATRSAATVDAAPARGTRGALAVLGGDDRQVRVLGRLTIRARQSRAARTHVLAGEAAAVPTPVVGPGGVEEREQVAAAVGLAGRLFLVPAPAVGEQALVGGRVALHVLV